MTECAAGNSLDGFCSKDRYHEDDCDHKIAPYDGPIEPITSWREEL